MWFEIEEHWDYGYVEVSSDQGQTWDILVGQSTSTENPNGSSFGAGYTGQSNGWIEETFDLSQYVGREVWLRFEYVTDDAVNRAGWLIDDIRIPELNYADDFESGAGEWKSQGFIYSDNQVSQRYQVQLLTVSEGQPLVTSMRLDETQHGQVELRGLGRETDRAVLVISALAPVTTQVAPYEYTVRPLDH
jgi:hypothetical protein